MPNLYHFSINADDVARARRFYERAFGWKFNAWGPPNFYMIETNVKGEPPPGVRASLLDDSPIFDLVRHGKIEQLIDKAALPNSESKFLFYFLNAKMFLEEFAS